MNVKNVATVYAKVGVESGVNAADPHKLIAMLYQGALLAIANAKSGILRNDIAVKGTSISKAIAIIDEGLNACLDKKVGGQLAQNLSALYEYMCTRLMVANLKNDIAILDEVATLLSEIGQAWESIRPEAMQTNPIQAMPQPVAAQAKPAPNTHLVYSRV